jgi:hypothetical protein
LTRAITYRIMRLKESDTVKRAWLKRKMKAEKNLHNRYVERGEQ